VAEELLPYLEGQCGLRCCVHERDFKVGLAVTENIVDCLDNSRTFMIVFSRSFLNSKWCKFECHLAQLRFFSESASGTKSDSGAGGAAGGGHRDKNKTFLLIKDDVKISEMDKNIRFIFKTWTYLRWPGDNHSSDQQSLFWKRLRIAFDKF